MCLSLSACESRGSWLPCVVNDLDGILWQIQHYYGTCQAAVSDFMARDRQRIPMARFGHLLDFGSRGERETRFYGKDRPNCVYSIYQDQPVNVDGVPALFPNHPPEKTL